MSKDSFSRVLSFLLGASWAFIILGAAVTFKFFIFFGLPTAVFAVFVFLFFALFFILVLDGLIIHRKKFLEIKKQTKLLEKIASKLEEKELD
jgi:hypothetical protein